MNKNDSMSAHTPGPWRVDGLLIKAIDHGKWYGIAIAGGSKLTIEGNMANARLIAAAPDLLAALKVATGYVEKVEATIPRGADGKNLCSADLELCRAALAKATGEV